MAGVTTVCVLQGLSQSHLSGYIRNVTLMIVFADTLYAINFKPYFLNVNDYHHIIIETLCFFFVVRYQLTCTIVAVPITMRAFIQRITRGGLRHRISRYERARTGTRNATYRKRTQGIAPHTARYSPVAKRS